jgi:hypothetical protein
MEDVNKLAKRGTLMLEEPVEDGPNVIHYPPGGIYSDVPYRFGPVNVVAHDVLIHLDYVVRWEASGSSLQIKMTSFLCIYIASNKP